MIRANNIIKNLYIFEPCNFSVTNSLLTTQEDISSYIRVRDFVQEVVRMKSKFNDL